MSDTGQQLPRVLMVGVGGLGSAAGLVLARSRSLALTLIDDDEVEESNLHRQLVYSDADVGRSKIEAALDSLTREATAAGHVLEGRTHRGRFTPATAEALLEGHELVIEGSDNLATKFFTADVCHKVGVPVVQAAAVRWRGWALATLPGEGPCMRCVFEDIPHEQPETCAVAGVVGSVVGSLGALEAALALRILAGDPSVSGELWSYDALAGRLRKTKVRRRGDCALCNGLIADLSPERYAPPCAT